MNSPSEQYPSNAIKSTSTNLLTFVPLNLFGQLKNLANRTCSPIVRVFYHHRDSAGHPIDIGDWWKADNPASVIIRDAHCASKRRLRIVLSLPKRS